MFVVIAYRLSDGLGGSAEGSRKIKNDFILILNLWEDSGTVIERDLGKNMSLVLPTFDYSLLKSHFIWIYMCSI